MRMKLTRSGHGGPGPRVLRARADETARRVRFDGVRDPADGSPEREEQQRRVVGHAKGSRDRRQAEIQVWVVAQQLCSRAQQMSKWPPRRFVGAFLREAHQEHRAWIAGRVQRMAESWHAFSATQSSGEGGTRALQ